MTKIKKKVKYRSRRSQYHYHDTKLNRLKSFLRKDTSGWKILPLSLFLVIIGGIIFYALPNPDHTQNTPNVSKEALPSQTSLLVKQPEEPALVNTPLPVSTPSSEVSKIGKSALRVIVFEGASNTEGFPAHLVSYASVIATQLKANYYKQGKSIRTIKGANITVFNVGNGGNVLEDIIPQAAVQVDSKYNPKTAENYVFLQAGSNDLVSGKTAEKLQKQIVEYCQGRKKRGFKVGVITIFDRANANKEIIIRYNQWLRKNYQSFADLMIDARLHPALSNATSPIYFQSDGVHLTNEGHTVLGNLIIEELKN